MTQTLVQMPPRLPWLSAVDVFTSELPPVPWVIEGMELAPGRPNKIVGLGGGGKSWDVMEIARAVATGEPAFGHFDVRQGEVRHISWEMGAPPVMRRYRRLANGNRNTLDQLEPLRVIAHPPLFLNSDGAEDILCHELQGATLAIFDSLRRGVPGADENASEMSNYLDILNRVAAQTGVTVLLIHHTGKADPDDLRLAGRGSSAIMDGAGCIWLLSGSGDGPRKMTQTRPHEDGDGDCTAFYIEMQRIHVDDPLFEVDAPPVKLAWRSVDEMSDRLADAETNRREAKIDEAARKVLDAIVRTPGIVTRELWKVVGKTSTNDAALDRLKRLGRVRVEIGDRNAQHHYPGTVGDCG